MRRLGRSEAIHILVRDDAERLSQPARASLLGDWWTLGADDERFAALPEAIQAELLTTAEPTDPSAARYDALVELALTETYAGVRNQYLEARLVVLGHSVTVEGTVEPRAPCPCCKYRSLERRRAYEICGVCFWEDDGTERLEDVSGPNHMTLGEARQNFAKLGAVEERLREHVLPDGKDRFDRE